MSFPSSAPPPSATTPGGYVINVERDDPSGESSSYTAIGKAKLEALIKGGIANPSTQPFDAKGRPGIPYSSQAISSWNTWYNQRYYGKDAIALWQSQLIEMNLLDPNDITGFGIPDIATQQATGRFASIRESMGNPEFYSAINQIKSGAAMLPAGRGATRQGISGGGDVLERVPAADLETEIIAALQDTIGAAPQDKVERWMAAYRGAENSYLSRYDAMQQSQFSRQVAAADGGPDTFTPSQFLEKPASPAAMIRNKLEFSPDAELFKAGLFGLFVMDIMRGGSPATVG